LCENGQFGFQIRRLDIGNQSPLEAAVQAFLQSRDLLGGSVAGNDDLLLSVIERVESMEKLLLRSLLPGQELNVVHQQDVDIPISLPELKGVVEPDGIDKVVNEPLGGDIEQFEAGLLLPDRVTNGVHQVGLPQAHSPVDEHRIVSLGRLFRHGQAGGVRELVAEADHEPLESVLGVKPVLTAVALGGAHKRDLVIP
jgi:hypothetical protein